MPFSILTQFFVTLNRNEDNFFFKNLVRLEKIGREDMEEEYDL